MKRTLTIHFHRAITDPKAETLEVVVTPLSTANNPERDKTILGLKQVRKVTLREPVTTVTFEMTPTHENGLGQIIPYRIAWRRGSFGRIESYEFSMPNKNVDFDDLFDLGQIITGENYLLREDMGVAGGVARLNEDGQVLDANGNIILSGDTTDLWNKLNSEIDARDAAIDRLRRNLIGAIGSSEEAVESRLGTRIESLGTELGRRITDEAGTRRDEDSDIRDEVSAVRTSISESANKLRAEFDAADRDWASKKASLVNGKVPAHQIPDIALGTALPVSTQSAMLQLTSEQVQPGDLAVRPDGTFMLIDDNPRDINSWKRITSKNAVSSVNGETGDVTLTASDVDARPDNVKIHISELSGLNSALENKADKTFADQNRALITTETTRTDALQVTVNGMREGWAEAVQQAQGYASAADQSAQDAAQSESNISDVEQSVNQTLQDVRGVRDNVNTTAGKVRDDANQVVQDRETTAQLAAVATTAAYLLQEEFRELGPIVNSVNSVTPDESGNVSIFGGGTDLTLTEDSENTGLFHVVADTEQE